VNRMHRITCGFLVSVCVLNLLHLYLIEVYFKSNKQITVLATFH